MSTYLWQNFLIDNKIRHYLRDKIQKLYQESWSQVLIEIWPGKWSLTKLIKDISPDFFVIEKDPKLLKDGKLNIEWLENIDLIHADVLEVDVGEQVKKRWQNPQKALVVGNLPYYITSPILRKFFGEGQQDFVGGIFMLQKEVADKLSSDAKKKSYLRWILHFAYQVKYLKTVPAKAFSPAPKVQSAIIEIRKKEEVEKVSFEELLEFLDDFAPYSRKTLGAIAKMLAKKKTLSREIPAELTGKRLEELQREEVSKILL